MGNLVQLVTARRLQNAGHTPYILVGGATGMIGDPKDSGERTSTPSRPSRTGPSGYAARSSRSCRFEGDNAATMVNNYDWTENLSTIDFLRDIGKHFPVNRMLARDVVRTRLEDGISYTEFSYVLLQSMDFLELFRRHGVTLQFGGSDQWGNLTGGVELIRRADGGKAHAFATPLVTKADGTKYGKTEAGALWLDPEMMSPYAFYQFWLNVEDEKVGELLRIFTFLSRAEIEELDAQTAEKPFLRAGPEGARRARDHPRARRRGDRADQGGLGRPVRRRRARRPERRHPGRRAARGGCGPGRRAARACPASSTCSSRPGSRRARARRGAPSARAAPTSTTCGSRTPTWCPAPDDLIGGTWLVLRRGKKNFAGVEVA